MNINNFSATWETNPIVQWFRSQNFEKGTRLDEKELAQKLDINPIRLNHGFNYLWSTDELLYDKKGWYVGEGKVKYVKNEGWYLKEKLIRKI